jgi:hypothetical protein
VRRASRTCGLVILLVMTSGCGERADDHEATKAKVAATVRANLTRACAGDAACLAALDQHFDACLDEYISATERDGEADPHVMAKCLNEKSGREWFSWREKR